MLPHALMQTPSVPLPHPPSRHPRVDALCSWCLTTSHAAPSPPLSPPDPLLLLSLLCLLVTMCTISGAPEAAVPRLGPPGLLHREDGGGRAACPPPGAREPKGGPGLYGGRAAEAGGRDTRPRRWGIAAPLRVSLSMHHQKGSKRGQGPMRRGREGR